MPNPNPARRSFALCCSYAFLNELVESFERFIINPKPDMRGRRESLVIEVIARGCCSDRHDSNMAVCNFDHVLLYAQPKMSMSEPVHPYP